MRRVRVIHGEPLTINDRDKNRRQLRHWNETYNRRHGQNDNDINENEENDDGGRRLRQRLLEKDLKE